VPGRHATRGDARRSAATRREALMSAILPPRVAAASHLASRLRIDLDCRTLAASVAVCVAARQIGALNCSAREI